MKICDVCNNEKYNLVHMELEIPHDNKNHRLSYHLICVPCFKRCFLDE